MNLNKLSFVLAAGLVSPQILNAQTLAPPLCSATFSECLIELVAKAQLGSMDGVMRGTVCDKEDPQRTDISGDLGTEIDQPCKAKVAD